MPHLPYAGIVGNGRTCALIDARGRVAWLCLPTFAQYPVFARLLDPVRGGCLELGLAVKARLYWSGDYGYCEQRYLDGTDVLVTTWSVATYRVTITDTMPWGQNELVRDIRIENERDESEAPVCVLRMAPNQGAVAGARIGTPASPTGFGSRRPARHGTPRIYGNNIRRLNYHQTSSVGSPGRPRIQSTNERILPTGKFVHSWPPFVDGRRFDPRGSYLVVPACARRRVLCIREVPYRAQAGCGNNPPPARAPSIRISDARCPANGRLLCEAATGKLLASWADQDSLFYRFAPANGRLTLRLVYQEGPTEPARPEEPSADPIAASAAADRAWLSGAARLKLPDAGFAAAYDRSLLALRLLCYEPTGAILAAPTASLPSEPGGDRNWDYRFCWVRDGCYAAQALARAGALAEACALYRFLLDREVGGQWPSPLWPIEPGYATDEQEVAGLCGPGGETPVRVGNAAALQDQHDSPGNVLSGVYQYCLASGDAGLAEDYWPGLARAAGWCAGHWSEPEAGIWEKRDRLRPWVHGRAMCWAGLRDAARLARMLGRPVPPAWSAAAAAIASELIETGWSEEQGFIGRACDSPAVCDTSVLALLLEGLVDPAEPRMRRTLERLATVLGHRRGYRRDEENRRAPFGLTTLWMARSFLLAGDYARGLADLQAVLDASTDLGLLAEYFDPVTGAQWGNFPQAFSHEELVKAITGMLWDWDGDRLLLFPGIPPAWLLPGAVLSAENVPIAGRRIAIQLAVEDDALRFATAGAQRLPVEVPARYHRGNRHVVVRAQGGAGERLP